MLVTCEQANQSCCTHTKIPFFHAWIPVIVTFFVLFEVKSYGDIQAPVVQTADNFIHWIGRYAADKICARISL